MSAAAVQAFAVVYFNGMGSTRLQGLRYANTVVTTRGTDGEVFYTGREEGDKLFSEVWPAEDFSDVHVETPGDGRVLTGEPTRSSCWRWILGVPDQPGFVYRLVPWKWLPPAHSEHVQKGIRDVRDALAKHPGPIVVYGASRGAGLLFLVMEQLTKDERARIHLAVAEAPFDSAWNVVLDRLSQMGYPWWLVEPFRPLQSFIPFLSKSPFEADFPHDVPLIMASGTEDESCISTGQIRLALKLEESGHPDFEHIILEGANHNNIWQRREFIEAVRRRLP